MRLAVLFNFIGCTILTFAPVVRFHSWNVELRWQQWIGFAVWIIGFLLLHRQIMKVLPDRDPYIFPIVSLLSAWGLLTIFRLMPGYGFRQTIWLAICFVMLFLALKFKNLLAFLRRYKYIWLTAGLVLTLLTFIMGVYPGGAGPNLWLNIFGMYLQPSEILKILLVIYLSAYLADNLHVRFRILQLLMPTMILAGAALLILVAQHDLGTASLFISLYAIIIYLASGKRRILLISFIAVIAALVAGYLVFDVIQLRIEAWLNPWLDPNGRSYQIVQSILAVANGGIFGRGIGLGSPGVVPVAQSDFIFPAIFEETGLFGAGALLIILAFFAMRGFSIALRAPNSFQRFLASGLTTVIIVQAILIIGGSIRLLPLTGVTLPFISYGGSSLITSFFSVSLLLIISNQGEDQPAALERSKPYLIIGSVLLAAFGALLLISGWWSVIRSDDLLLRNDNPRRFISDQYVLRGSIVDRNNQLITQTTGDPGNYTRTMEYPDLSAVIGYSDASYGQAGLEASQDGILRGVTDNNYFEVFWNRLLYSQYPKGNDLRISIDLSLQKAADEQFTGQKGSMIVLNADSGEIFSLTTAPTFDANKLADQMESWKADPESPLLNRATQGLYPPGSATGGLILTYMQSTNQSLPEIPQFYRSTQLGDSFYCALQPGLNLTWQSLITDGCPLALEQVSSVLKPVEIYSLYQKFGLLNQPELQIESSVPQKLDTFNDMGALFRGESNLLVTPLQMALAYAPFSNSGYFVEPTIAQAYRLPGGDWQLFKDSGTKSLSELSFSNNILKPAISVQSGWSISATVPTESGHLDWYIQGTPDNWQGVPIIVVVALEDSTASEAQRIGLAVFLNATSQNQ